MKVYGVFYHEYAEGLKLRFLNTNDTRKEDDQTYSRFFNVEEEAEIWADICTQRNKKWDNDQQTYWCVEELEVEER